MKRTVKITDNRSIAHAFFYQTGEYYCKHYHNCSYSDDLFFSYGTAVGRKLKNNKGQDVLLYSADNMSISTGRHLNYLRSACPFGIQISVPLHYGRSHISLADIVDDLIDNLQHYSGENLGQKANRGGLSNAYRTLKVLIEQFEGLSEFTRTRTIENIKAELNSYKEVYESVNDPEKLKKLKEARAKKAREQAKKLKEELADLMNGFGYLELVKSAYKYGDGICRNNPELKSKLRKYFNPKNELSFIWEDDAGLCVTSQGVRMEVEKVMVALKMWKEGRLKRGMMIGQYTVLEIGNDFVKVGCHKIPVENLNCLFDHFWVEYGDKIPDVEL